MSIYFLPIILPRPTELELQVEILLNETETDQPKTPESDKESLYGPQDLFKSWKLTCIKNITHSLQKLRKCDFKTCLYPTLLAIGQERNKIAALMQTSHHEKFGLFRNDDLCVSRWREYTTQTHLLPCRYREFNQKMRSLFFLFMPLFQYNVDKCCFETDFSQYTIEKIDQTRLKSLIERARKPLTLRDNVDRVSQNHLIELLNVLGGVHDMVRNLKLPGFDLPQFPQIGDIQFLVGTIKNKIEGEWQLLTRHITWIKQSHSGPVEDEAIDYFKRYGFATLCHTPRSSIRHLIDKHLEGLTKQLIQKSYEDSKEFKRDLAVWEYRMFHVMPFLRGSTNSIEILRESICNLLEKELPTTTDEDAFIQPFLETYIKGTFREKVTKI